MQTNLVGWSQAGPELTDLILGRLEEFWNISVVHRFETEIIVEYGNRWYAVFDNGGEIDVDLINVEHLRPSVPTETNPRIDTDTTAYRLAQVIKQQPIDWEYRLDLSDLDNKCRTIYAGPMEPPLTPAA
ncbi:MAG: hypothetical protein GWN58_53930 [Anaerolineae bacterium]|nr:hypothetical protein [Anaerolineae bacterium]